MKGRLQTVLAAMLVLLTCQTAVRAAGKTYTLDALDAEVTAPEAGFYILTRDMAEDDAALAGLGFTSAQVNELLSANNIYLDAVYMDASYEIAVQMQTGEDYEKVFDYSLLNNTQRDEARSEVKDGLEKLGYTVNEIAWYQGNENIYMTIDCVLPDSNGWMYQYLTLHNGKSISVVASSAGMGEVTDEIKAQTKAMADGLHFTRTDPVPETVKEFYEAAAGMNWGKILTMTAIGAGVGAVVTAVIVLLQKGKKKRAQMVRPEQPLPDESEGERVP